MFLWSPLLERAVYYSRNPALRHMGTVEMSVWSKHLPSLYYYGSGHQGTTPVTLFTKVIYFYLGELAQK